MPFDVDSKLTEISDKCKGYSVFYFNKSRTYSTTNTILNVINIAFTTITGIISTYTATVSKTDTVYLSYISSFMLYTSAGINSVQQFLNLESLSEKRKTSAMRFLAMSNNIIKYLYTDDASMDRKEYLKWVLTEYESILSQESLVANKMVLEENETSQSSLDVRVTGEATPPAHYKYEVDRFLVTSYNNDTL